MKVKITPSSFQIHRQQGTFLKKKRKFITLLPSNEAYPSCKDTKPPVPFQTLKHHLAIPLQSVLIRSKARSMIFQFRLYSGLWPIITCTLFTSSIVDLLDTFSRHVLHLQVLFSEGVSKLSSLSTTWSK